MQRSLAMPKKEFVAEYASTKRWAQCIFKKNDAGGAAAVELLTRWRSAQEKPLHSWIAHLEEDAGGIRLDTCNNRCISKKGGRYRW